LAIYPNQINSQKMSHSLVPDDIYQGCLVTDIYIDIILKDCMTLRVLCFLIPQTISRKYFKYVWVCIFHRCLLWKDKW
jgi:hypothetical protein